MRGATTLRTLAALDSWPQRLRYGAFAVARRLGLPVGVELILGTRKGQEIIEQGGYRFRPRPRSADLVALLPIHELLTRRWIERGLQRRPTGVFLDVGAHCGSFSILLERHFTRVIAVEPLPDNRAALAANLALNESLAKKIEVAPFAAGASDGEAVLHLFGDDTPSLVSGTGTGQTLAVQLRRVDTLLAERGIAPFEVALLKIDVEGAERDVLRGASKLLAEGNPLVVAEANTEAAARELIEDMRERAYASDGMLDARNLVFRKSGPPRAGRA